MSIKIHNVTTGEIFERELTAEEIEQGLLAKQKADQERAEAETKKAAAQAKLAALGLDEDDLKALGL